LGDAPRVHSRTLRDRNRFCIASVPMLERSGSLFLPKSDQFPVKPFQIIRFLFVDLIC
jgi:hypothetical protein